MTPVEIGTLAHETVEELLNQKEEKTMASFITGSRAYGKPTLNSDTDLVVRVTPEEANILVLCADQDGKPTYEGADTMALRFGNLNLICCMTAESYDQWKRGTTILKQLAPVERSLAMAVFKQIREVARNAH